MAVLFLTSNAFYIHINIWKVGFPQPRQIPKKNLLLIYLVGRYSAEQQSKDFSDAFSICMREAAFTPALHTCFIKSLSSFAQTSVMAFCDVKRSCAGLILSFLCPFSEITEYVPIWGRRRWYLDKYGVECNGIPASQLVSIWSTFYI